MEQATLSGVKAAAEKAGAALGLLAFGRAKLDGVTSGVFEAGAATPRDIRDLRMLGIDLPDMMKAAGTDNPAAAFVQCVNAWWGKESEVAA